MKKALLFCISAITFAGGVLAQQITGITNAGGDFGFGSTYSYDPVTGKDSLLFNFGGKSSSIMLGNPQGNVIQASNGLLYGMGYVGGNYNDGGIFSYNPATGKDSVLVSFNHTNGYQPTGSLLQASNGLLYGTTPQGGLSSAGVMFCYNPITGRDSILLNFDGGVNGGNPSGSLMQASNGLLFGMTSFGGANNKGVIYSFDPVTGKDSVRFNFTDSSGFETEGSLMQASNGLLYGYTITSGRYGGGTMFCFNPVTNQDSVLIWFNVINGQGAFGALMQASNGLLYGLTCLGGSGYGTMFLYNPVTGKDSVLFNFTGPNGQNPRGSLIQASDGFIYATTQVGGTNHEGVIFRYNPATGKDSVIINMSGINNGDAPYGDLFEAADGYLYGMTMQGGSSGTGILFRLNKVTLNDSVLLNFGVSSDQAENAPIQASDGMVYGMTLRGGTYDLGTLFKYNPVTGKDTVLLDFNNSNGANPNGSLIQAKNGLLYGMTSFSNAVGNLFSYDPVTYKDSVLVDFYNYNAQNPEGSLIQASDGLLYGTISNGGNANYNGVIFSYNIVTGKDSTLYNFNDTMGSYPYGTLTEGKNKMLYGTAANGGKYGFGVLFSYDIIHAQYDTLISFNRVHNSPQGNLIVDTASNIIYGATNGGGDAGTLFSYNLNTKTLNTLIQFNDTNGFAPTGLLIWDTAANYIYSTTYQGGSNNYGVLYRYNTATQQDTVLYSFQDSLVLSHRHHGPSHANTVGVSPSGIMLTKNNLTKVNNVVHTKDVIKVYPNPTSTNTTVVFSADGKHYLEMVDVKGRKLRTIQCTGKQYQLNCEGLAPGVYFITTHDEGQKLIATAKIIIE